MLNRKRRTKPEPSDKLMGDFTPEQPSNRKEAIQKRLKGIKPVMSFDFKTKPFPHQIEAFNWGLKFRSLLLADDQGLGKTKEAIDISVARKIRGDVSKVLIVCGVNSVKYNWQKEIGIHSEEASRVLDGSTEEKYYAIDKWIESDALFGIINIESLRKEEIVRKFLALTEKGIIGLVIIDEIHKAKNGQTSQQGIAIRLLRSQYKIGLTGTPIMNNALDLHNVLTWLGVEKRNFYAYRNYFCELGGYNNTKVMGMKEGKDKELNTLLNKVMLRRLKDEVLDLPPKIRSVEYVELTSKQRTLYDQIRFGLLDQVEDILISPNPLASLIRLRQVTGGVLGEANPKLDRLKEIIEDEVIPNGRKIIIFSQWSKVTKAMKDALKKYKPAYIDGDTKDRMAEVDRFQEDSKCSVIIGTIGAMGTGLTLNKSSYVVFMDKAWTPADNNQAEDRAHRIGTENTINVITMVAQGTIDERIEGVLEGKRSLIDAIVEGKMSKEQQRDFIMDLLRD
jgi:SNF2 family DNA or RNA helicase